MEFTIKSAKHIGACGGYKMNSETKFQKQLARVKFLTGSSLSNFLGDDAADYMECDRPGESIAQRIDEMPVALVLYLAELAIREFNFKAWWEEQNRLFPELHEKEEASKPTPSVDAQITNTGHYPGRTAESHSPENE